MFRITSGKGFQMTFANGWTISVQFGGGNYCDNYNKLTTSDRETGERGSSDAEIAAFDKDGNWHQFGAESVKGYCSPDEVATFIADIAKR